MPSTGPRRVEHEFDPTTVTPGADRRLDGRSATPERRVGVAPVASARRRSRHSTNSTTTATDRPAPAAWPTGAPATSSRSTGSACGGLDPAGGRRRAARDRRRCVAARRRGRCVGVGLGVGDSTSRSRFSTNWPISFDDTSASTPRPNCATLPVIDRSVTTSTRVPPSSSAIVTTIVRLGVALATRVAPGRVDHDAASRLVDLGELRRALVLRGDRADLHLHDAAVLVALDLLQLRAGQARRDALDVEQHLPRVLDRRAHSEAVCDLHRCLQRGQVGGGVDVGRVAGAVARYLDRAVTAQEHPRALVAGERRAPRASAGDRCSTGLPRTPP